MPDRNQQESYNTDSSSSNTDTNRANKGHGPQGIDKAPGEEPSQDNDQFVQETQKGKKVDRDPSDPNDEPVEE